MNFYKLVCAGSEQSDNAGTDSRALVTKVSKKVANSICCCVPLCAASQNESLIARGPYQFVFLIKRETTHSQKEGTETASFRFYV